MFGSLSSFIGQLSGDESGSVLEKCLFGLVGISSKIKLASDFTEAPEADVARRKWSSDLVNAVVNNQLVQVVGKLARRTIFVVVGDIPAECDLASVRVAAD